MMAPVLPNRSFEKRSRNMKREYHSTNYMTKWILCIVLLSVVSLMASVLYGRATPSVSAIRRQIDVADQPNISGKRTRASFGYRSYDEQRPKNNTTLFDIGSGPPRRKLPRIALLLAFPSTVRLRFLFILQ